MSTPQPEAAVRYEKRYFNGQGGFRVVFDERSRATMSFDGKGTMEGTHALVEVLEEVERLMRPGEKVDACVDLSQMDGAPLRSQFVLGKWMVERRQKFGRLAIYGGKAIEMGVARAVMKIAGIQSVGFFDTETQARAWLERGAAPGSQ
jgi:hypothetical protein